MELSESTAVCSTCITGHIDMLDEQSIFTAFLPIASIILKPPARLALSFSEILADGLFSEKRL